MSLPRIDKAMGADEEMLLMNEDGRTIRRAGNESKKPLLPVGVWAKIESLRVNVAVRIGTNSERTFFSSKEFNMLLLTNRTVRIKSRGNTNVVHAYVPLENVCYYSVELDAAFEARFAKDSE